MIPLAIIRPEPGCAASVKAARALGLAAEGFPLFKVRSKAWDAPDAGLFDAVLVGSANVFRRGGQPLALYRHLPVHVVGRTTAKAAEAAGFTVGMIGSGGLQGVLDRMAPGTRLLRLAGAERIALTLPDGVSMAERVIYAVEALPVSDGLAEMLARPLVVALHSAEAAQHFREECARLGLDRAQIALACIGPRVGAAAGAGWGAVSSAGTPDEAALLACARDLCQNPWPQEGIYG